MKLFPRPVVQLAGSGAHPGNYLPADPLAGTHLAHPGRIGTNEPTVTYVDVSLESPDQQFAALVAMIEADDAANPAPFTGTPPWDEGIEVGENIPDTILEHSYTIPADLEAAAEADILALTRDAFPPDYPVVHWTNDPQYHGLGVPPGSPNFDQPIESGHTQIIRQNPAAEQGWDAWSGRFPMARVPRQFSDNPFYSAETNRGHEVVPEKFDSPYWLLTQQRRDLLLAELKRRGVHNVVVSDVPSVPYTEQVIEVDPLAFATHGEPIGMEGVLPWSGEDVLHGGHLAAHGGV